MNKKLVTKVIGKVLAACVIAVLLTAIIALSWAAVCGIIKLIVLCFALKFSYEIATGVWLVMVLIGATFKTVGGNKNG